MQCSQRRCNCLFIAYTLHFWTQALIFRAQSILFRPQSHIFGQKASFLGSEALFERINPPFQCPDAHLLRQGLTFRTQRLILRAQSPFFSAQSLLFGTQTLSLGYRGSFSRHPPQRSAASGGALVLATRNGWRRHWRWGQTTGPGNTAGALTSFRPR